MPGTLTVRRSWQGALIVALGDEDALLPRKGAPVNLVVDDVRVRAHIVGAAEGRLELAASVIPESLRLAGSADARIEFVADRGPCRLLGSAALASRTATERQPGLNVLFAHDSPGQLLLRGDRVRARVETEIEVHVRGLSKRTRTRDLRAGGALVQGPLEAQVGDNVRYSVRVPGRRESVEGFARVARVTEEGDVAIQFGDLDEDDRADIMLAVFQAQREGAR
jgi:hypothetical protein